MMLLIHSSIVSYLIKILDFVMMDFYVLFLANGPIITTHWYSFIYIFKIFKLRPRVRATMKGGYFLSLIHI